MQIKNFKIFEVKEKNSEKKGNGLKIVFRKKKFTFFIKNDTYATRNSLKL